jgi:mannose-6-phosphate isomerase-like protein (cupin superfamily)
VPFDTKGLSAEADAIAPDGCEVRVLLGLTGGGMAHFTLAPGECSVAVRHRTVEEIWFVLGGRGEMWRSDGSRTEIIDLNTGTCATIPLGTAFQLRASERDVLRAVAVTMPPWPGADEAIRAVGPWLPTVAPGVGLASE